MDECIISLDKYLERTGHSEEYPPPPLTSPGRYTDNGAHMHSNSHSITVRYFTTIFAKPFSHN